MDAIRIAFSTITYNKDIYFNKSDFHINKLGQKTETSQIDVYLDDVPKNFTLPYSFRRRKCRQKSCVDNIHDFKWGMDGKLYRNSIKTER